MTEAFFLPSDPSDDDRGDRDGGDDDRGDRDGGDDGFGYDGIEEIKMISCGE